LTAIVIKHLLLCLMSFTTTLRTYLSICA
jgi:hypothetical protein